VALLGGTAHANTVTVGSSLTASNFSLVDFSSAATVTNFTLPLPATATSPVDGTVISWRFIGQAGPLTPRVLRATNGASMTGAGTGTPQNATAPSVVSGPFPLSLPIKKGDYFGVDGAGPAFLSSAPTPGATNLYFQPAITEGGGEQAPFGTNVGEDAISATVRYCMVPKMKGLSGKAARQALNAADCQIGQVTKGKKKPIKKVLKQGVKAGSSISDTQPVDLTISRKKKH
jgi:PASTA domain